MPCRSVPPTLLRGLSRATVLFVGGAFAAVGQEPPAVDLHWAALQGDVDAW